MLSHFTPRAQRVIILAQEEARRLNHAFLGTEHLLLGIVALGEGIASEILRRLGVDLKKLRLEVERRIGTGDNILLSGDMPFSPRAKRVLEYAVEESHQLGQNFVGTEHLLLGLMREEQGEAAKILEEIGVTAETVRNEVTGMLSGNEPVYGQTEAPPPPPGQKKVMRRVSVKTPTLDEFGRDLTRLASQGKLDPVIGRDHEIQRVIQILTRRTKNNPVLLGDPGVGKTAIVEGLAERISDGNIPQLLADRRVVTLDLPGVVAGTKYRGEFEQRLRQIMNEIRQAQGKIILFIDELHTVMGAGAAEGAIDASNMLKPALSRGEVQCIGATTLDAYRKHIEKDAALTRRFQPIIVNPPTVDETVEILKGLKSRYEAHHGVRFSDEALRAASILSSRFIPDRFLPDKAVDLMDEAGSRMRLDSATVPQSIRKLEQKLERLNKEKQAAISGEEFERAALLKSDAEKVEGEIKKLRREWEQDESHQAPIIGEEQIAEVVSEWTGIPVAKLTEKESDKLLKMEEALHRRVVGQDEAINAISRAVRRSRTGLKELSRPIGSFLFLGPTGVGKTELARTLAEFMFGDENALIRIDMSEYMEKFNVSRLVGAPPGYVGYEEGGQLTEKVRRKPYSVILLDEIEKAHADVFNILLQVFEDGQLTDSLGHRVDFRNTIIIMTSNLGARELMKGQGLGFARTQREEGDYEQMKGVVLEEVKKFFRPEFLNRIDETVVFHPLSREDLKKIVDLMLSKIITRLNEQYITLEVTENTKNLLMEKGYNPQYGARPLRRTIQSMLEDKLAEESLRRKMPTGPDERLHIKADVQNDRITFAFIPATQ